MNADGDGFNLENQDGPGGADATPAEGTPFPAERKPGGGVHHPSEPRGTTPRPAERRAARRAAPAKETKEPASGLPFLFRPGFLLVLGALVLAVLWAGGLFSLPAEAGAWPWTFFQTEGGAVTFTWDALHVFTALGAFFVVFFLLTPFAPALRSRGATVLTVVALGLVIFPPLGLLDRLAALLGLAAAAVLSREGLRDGTGGRALLFVMLLLLGACLFFPIELPGEPFDAQALAVAEDLAADDAFLAVLQEPRTALVLSATLVFLVALLSWIGLGGRWSVWVAGIALYLGVLGPAVLAYLESGRDCVTCQEGLAGVVAGLPAAFLAYTLPTAAGTIDASRP